MDRGWHAATIVAFALAAGGACGGGTDDPDSAASASAEGCAQIAVNGNRTASEGLADVSLLTDKGDHSDGADTDDGAGSDRLLTGDWVATDPSLSPDGRHVVVVRADGDYESAGPGSTTLWVMGTDGTAPRALTTGQHHGEPAWSPDGTHIAFSAYADGHETIAVVSVEGGETRTVVDVPGTSFRAPAWSPDGAQLAILGDDEDVPYRSDTSAWTVGADGTDLVEVASLAGAAAGAHSLDWHPDSESLLLSSAEALGIWTVSLVDLATGEVPTLAEDAGMAAWSPDGDGVYYFTGAGDDRWGLAYGVIEDGALVADRSLGPTVVPLYQYYGLDAGACAAVG